MVVLNSRNRQGNFKRLKESSVSKQPCNNTRPKIHPHTYWYNAINPKNVFKRFKYTLGVELQHLENFLNNEMVVCLPAYLTTRTGLPLKPLGIWLPYFFQATVILVRLNLSCSDKDSSLAPWCYFHFPLLVLLLGEGVYHLYGFEL